MNLTNLSPRTVHGLLATLSVFPRPLYGDEPAKAKRHIERIVQYVCPVCEEHHDFRSDAEDCCEDESTSHEEAGCHCPVCAREYSEPRVAADCCLWKDLDAPTRWRIADAVEAGATWAEAMGLPDSHTGIAP